jgi:probable H4MPT-linked C1 transfer pathway protein
MTMPVIGWDIGGVNTKCVRIECGEVTGVRHRPYELQRDPAALVPLLRGLADELDVKGVAAHAVTMTAELSQLFRTKREGVSFVLDAVESSWPRALVLVFTVDGRFLDPREARQVPLAVAAANWAATARAVAPHHPDALLIDVGTTTTDIVPIVGGSVAAHGRTDPERLATGELVYTGALRTPAEAIAAHVPVGGLATGVSAEGFALAGDVHLWRGDLAAADYSVVPPDGRPAIRAFAGERLARVVCGDCELLDEGDVTAIADALADAQAGHITAAIARVRARHPSIHTAVVTGLGAFLGERSARAAGLRIVPLSSELGEDASRCAPAAAVAILLERELREASRSESQRPTAAPPATMRPDLAPRIAVVKVGGALLSNPSHLAAVLRQIDAATGERLLVVPGGGPFADAVRAVDAATGLSDSDAHWMAILGMDQYAHLIASRLSRGMLVEDAAGVHRALGAGRVPVLAPYRWLREADPLPHSWDVTSDSIAAWVAGVIGAAHLVLVKPPGSAGSGLVDAHFLRELPVGVAPVIVPADESEALTSALARNPASP